MSKAGLAVMTESLAVEWGKFGIRLNAIAPGPLPTEGMSARLSPGQTAEQRSAAKNPMGRIGRMEELRNLATFLIADGCDMERGRARIPMMLNTESRVGDIHKYSATSILSCPRR